MTVLPRLLRESIVPPQTFRRPLECLAAAHERQRAMCDALSRLSADPDLWGDDEGAAVLFVYYTVELPLHVADEEEDVLPALRRRKLLAGEAGDLMLLLSLDHEKDRRLLARCLPELERLAMGKDPFNPIRFMVNGLAVAEAQRRHLEVETRELFPLAHILSQAEQRRIGRSMAMRRAAA